MPDVVCQTELIELPNCFKIYKIICNITEEIYFGSTKNPLEERLRQHKCKTRNTHCSCKGIIERGDFTIQLVENVQLAENVCKRERYYIETFTCVNKNLPQKDLSNEEKLKKTKEYQANYRKSEHAKNLRKNRRDIKGHW